MLLQLWLVIWLYFEFLESIHKSTKFSCILVDSLLDDHRESSNTLTRCCFRLHCEVSLSYAKAIVVAVDVYGYTLVEQGEESNKKGVKWIIMGL